LKDINGQNSTEYVEKHAQVAQEEQEEFETYKGTNSTGHIDCHAQVAQEEEEFERHERTIFLGIY
jgi:hypothetical protein